MFGILTSLTKAVVAVALTPVAVAVDIVTLPFDQQDSGDAFSRTEAMLESVGDNISDALEQMMSKELIESLRAGIVFYYKTSRINFIETERIMKEAASKIENLEREKEDMKIPLFQK